MNVSFDKPQDSMYLTPEFKASYRIFETWPLNTVHKGTYYYALQASKSRLDQISSDLFTSDGKNIDVRFRDLTGNDQGP